MLLSPEGETAVLESQTVNLEPEGRGQRHDVGHAGGGYRGPAGLSQPR